MKHIEKLLPEANRLLLDAKHVISPATKQVLDDGIYESYLAAFGPNVTMAGLLPTLQTYLGDTKKKRIADLILTLAEENETELMKHASDRYRMYHYTEKIVNASIALKIMIRTFKIKKGNNATS